MGGEDRVGRGKRKLNQVKAAGKERRGRKAEIRSEKEEKIGSFGGFSFFSRRRGRKAKRVEKNEDTFLERENENKVVCEWNLEGYKVLFKLR